MPIKQNHCKSFIKNHVNRMMRLLCMAVVSVLFITMFSVSAVAQIVAPGCDQDFYEIQVELAGVQQLRAIAPMKEMIPQNDSTLALTCFDQAIAVSSNAGAIFSDRFPSLVEVFALLPYDNLATGLGQYRNNPGILGVPGTSDMLIRQLTNTISDSLEEMLQQFFNAIIGQIGAYLTSTLVAILGSVVGSFAGGFLPGFSIDCERMQEIWDDYVVGIGINREVPYPTLVETLNVAIPGAGDVYQGVYDESSAILDSARDQMERFNIPGSIPSKPPVPFFPPNATVDDIISAM
jgi:hypothetical protein